MYRFVSLSNTDISCQIYSSKRSEKSIFILAPENLGISMCLLNTIRQKLGTRIRAFVSATKINYSPMLVLSAEV